MLGALDEAAYIANPEKSDSMTHQSQGRYWAEPERLRDRRLKVRHRRFFLLVAHLGGGRFTRPTAAVQTWRPELVFMPHTCRSLYTRDQLCWDRTCHFRYEEAKAAISASPTTSWLTASGLGGADQLGPLPARAGATPSQ